MLGLLQGFLHLLLEFLCGFDEGLLGLFLLLLVDQDLLVQEAELLEQFLVLGRPDSLLLL